MWNIGDTRTHQHRDGLPAVSIKGLGELHNASTNGSTAHQQHQAVDPDVLHLHHQDSNFLATAS